ncbi:MAG: hypothetical protein P8K79_07210 [Mariniblastus sp.]|nr:hypothetical protein [Mariniblastus sp.]
MTESTDQPESHVTHPQCVAESGPWPFITKRIFEAGDKKKTIWSSRHHRKHLRVSLDSRTVLPKLRLAEVVWFPRRMNWWMGVIFSLGALLFGLASLLSLDSTAMNEMSGWREMVAATFFVGSLFFTAAAYLQLFQSANAREFPLQKPGSSRRKILFGWRPRDIGWVSSALQFVGTIWFNLNTFDGMLPDVGWIRQDLLLWFPDMIGSIFFLISGRLAFLETCHKRWRWQPNNISWWVVFSNLLGCVAFMIAAVLAVSLPVPVASWISVSSVVFTLVGSIGFLIGSLLMLPESTSTYSE